MDAAAATDCQLIMDDEQARRNRPYYDVVSHAGPTDVDRHLTSLMEGWSRKG